MFFGEYNYSIDEKSRLRIPAKLKSNLEKSYVIVKGSSNSLFVFGKSYFENEFLSKLNNVPTFNVASQKPIRMLLSSTYEVEEDNQGRFLLPSYLKEFANIKKGVTIIGVGNRIEIWSEENWTNYKGDEHNFDDILQSLSSFDV